MTGTGIGTCSPGPGRMAKSGFTGTPLRMRIQSWPAGWPLTCGSSALSVGARATPYVHDWDEDGLPDLLCGDANGYVHFFRNVGTRQQAAYTNDVRIQAGGAPLNLGLRSAVRVCDWDHDGVKDLIGSGSDLAAWCRNVGTAALPVLANPVRLQAPSSGGGLVNVDTGYRMRLEIVDWNQDGLPDLLMGNWDGYIYAYESYRFLMTVQTGDRCRLGWTSAPFLRYNLLAGSSADCVADLVATNLPSGGVRSWWTNDLAGAQRFFRVQLAP